MSSQPSGANIDSLVEVMLPSHDPVGAARSLIETGNAVARARFLETIPCFNNQKLAEMVGHASRNPSATGSRWKTERRVFAVGHRGKDHFPAFQFLEARPIPVVADILAVLPGSMSAWQTAFWFVSTNPWLDGEVPSEHLDQAGRLVEAARMEGKAILG